MNSVQIIYYMPLLSLSYPKMFFSFMKYLNFAIIDIDIGAPFFYRFMYLS